MSFRYCALQNNNVKLAYLRFSGHRIGGQTSRQRGGSISLPFIDISRVCFISIGRIRLVSALQVSKVFILRVIYVYIGQCIRKSGRYEMAANLNDNRKQFTSYNRMKLIIIITQYLKMSGYRGNFSDKNFLVCLLKGKCSKNT